MNRPDLPASHPQNVPLREWTDGWLVLECASLLDDPSFVVLHDDEKEARSYPIGRDRMIAFIEAKGGGPQSAG